MTKRPRSTRRSQAEIAALRDALYEIVREAQPLTVRQVFYLAVSAVLIDKTEREYKNTVVRLLGLMREEGQLPFGWITDSTRWMTKHKSFDSPEEALRRTAQFYRRNLWTNRPDVVEVWVEKDSIAGVVGLATEEWDVPLMVCRGFASKSFLHASAKSLEASNKRAVIFTLTDHDPSGLGISTNIEQRLQHYAPSTEFLFRRLAVTEEQIDEFDLPTRPTKSTDSRAANWSGGDRSVELEALPPAALVSLVSDAIEAHVDWHELAVLEVAEESERLMLHKLARRTS